MNKFYSKHSNDRYVEFVRKRNLKLGDRIIRYKKYSFVKHHGLFMGYFNNDYWVAENQKGQGVRYVRLRDFFPDGLGFIKKVEKFNGTEQQRLDLPKRVRERIGKQYNVVGYNCENFVNEVLYGTSRSYQVENTFLGSVAALFVALTLIPEPNKGKKTYK